MEEILLSVLLVLSTGSCSFCDDCAGAESGNAAHNAGYNFGARQYPRVTRVLKLTIIGATRSVYVSS